MSSYERWILDDSDYQLIFAPRRKRANPTAMRGLANPSTKLSPADILAIRAEYADGRKVAAIARKYGISKSSASRIGRGEQQAFVK